MFLSKSGRQAIQDLGVTVMTTSRANYREHNNIRQFIKHRVEEATNATSLLEEWFGVPCSHEYKRVL